MSEKVIEVEALRDMIRELDRLRYHHVAHALMLAATSHPSLPTHHRELDELVALSRRLIAEKDIEPQG